MSPYYFSLIDRDDPADPIRRMIVPSSGYLIGAAPWRVVLRNFEGAIFGYPDGGTSASFPGMPACSLADLASGASRSLVPHGIARTQRRESVPDGRRGTGPDPVPAPEAS